MHFLALIDTSIFARYDFLFLEWPDFDAPGGDCSLSRDFTFLLERRLSMFSFLGSNLVIIEFLSFECRFSSEARCLSKIPNQNGFLLDEL